MSAAPPRNGKKGLIKIEYGLLTNRPQRLLSVTMRDDHWERTGDG